MEYNVNMTFYIFDVSDLFSDTDERSLCRGAI